MADPAELQARFVRHFGEQPALAFAKGTEPSVVIAREKEWWKRLVRRVFGEADEVRRPFAGFDDFFDEVYDTFGGCESWQLFPDLGPSLAGLRRRGLRLGVISNFDSRLFGLLEACALRQYFDVVMVSTIAGAAKPSPAIFEEALASMGVSAGEAAHVGDHPVEDVEAALAVGLRAILLDHHRRFADNPRFTRVTGFGQLLDLDFLRGESS